MNTKNTTPTKKDNEFKPFANSTQQMQTGPGEGLTFENSQEAIAVYGDITINKNDNVEKIDQLINAFTNIKNQMLNKNK